MYKYIQTLHPKGTKDDKMNYLCTFKPVTPCQLSVLYILLKYLNERTPLYKVSIHYLDYSWMRFFQML